MKKLLFKTAFFVVPFFLLFLLTYQFYNVDKGDLLRLGYVANTSNYNSKEVFKNEYNRKVKYYIFSNLDLKKQNNFSVFTIGDSFSEQGMIGYQNYLADNSQIKVLHLDRFLHENPLETVNGFLNGDVLNSIKVDYIILQSVERSIVERGINFNNKTIIQKDSLVSAVKKHQDKALKVEKEKSKDKFFCRETIKFPLYYVNFKFDDNAYSSEVYSIETNRNLFSTSNKNLLVLDQDLKELDVNNNKNNIEKLNDNLNFIAIKLKERGIKLIVLPSPDKLDFYYDQLVNKEKYNKPIFFDYFRNLNKNYIYIDAKKIILEKTRNTRDVYFYDDTHWSPVASQIIAKELEQIIQTK